MKSNINGFKKGNTLSKGRPAPWARNNLQTFKKGHKTWNKGKTGIHSSPSTEFKKGISASPATQFRKGAVPWNKGLKGYRAGPNNNLWKGGVTPVNQVIRTSVEYKKWRKCVFDRDDYTCQACGERGGKLQADHELPFALYPDLRFEVLNGRTLCVPCHKKTPTYGSRAITFNV
jgi:hypothetical protein